MINWKDTNLFWPLQDMKFPAFILFPGTGWTQTQQPHTKRNFPFEYGFAKDNKDQIQTTKAVMCSFRSDLIFWEFTEILTVNNINLRPSQVHNV